MSRTTFLEVGKVYALLGGGEYICRELPGLNEAVFERVSDGYTLTAVDIRETEHGEIYWAYSYGGLWPGRESDVASLMAKSQRVVDLLKKEDSCITVEDRLEALKAVTRNQC